MERRGEKNLDAIFITLGTGVGGGIVAAGELLHGVAGCAGEVGHVTVDPTALTVPAGNVAV